jgi:3' terminal RNA ribose 2'-O-methyltransferase Hen1
LLHKHPERVHETELGFGKAFVFYPEATDARCEAALVLDVDPVGLVRGKGSSDGLLDQYVNDRPYAASSFLSVALARTLRTAMGGTSKERPELAVAAISLDVTVTPLPARGGERLVRDLFEPLGWNVDVESIEGVGSQAGHASRYVSLRLRGEARLSALLNHLYVLVPVLDDAKHYWVGEDEISKLLSHGEGWLDTHPAKELIVQRYLKHRRVLANMALARLAPETEDEEAAPERRDAPEEALERPIRLNDARMDAVIDVLRASGAKKSEIRRFAWVCMDNGAAERQAFCEWSRRESGPIAISVNLVQCVEIRSRREPLGSAAANHHHRQRNSGYVPPSDDCQAETLLPLRRLAGRALDQRATCCASAIAYHIDARTSGPRRVFQ